MANDKKDSNSNPWTKHEVVKLVVSTLIPLVVLYFTLRTNRSLHEDINHRQREKDSTLQVEIQNKDMLAKREFVFGIVEKSLDTAYRYFSRRGITDYVGSHIRHHITETAVVVESFSKVVDTEFVNVFNAFKNECLKDDSLRTSYKLHYPGKISWNPRSIPERKNDEFGERHFTGEDNLKNITKAYIDFIGVAKSSRN